MRIFLAAGLIVAATSLAPTSAEARVRRYIGPHPLDFDGHWHMFEGLHTHDELVVGLDPFVSVGGVYLFLGDPGAYAYPNPAFGYSGAHPLPGGLSGYCGIDEIHSHVFAPEGPGYERDRDGNYDYRGTFRGGRAMLRPRLVRPDRDTARTSPAIAESARVRGYSESGYTPAPTRAYGFDPYSAFGGYSYPPYGPYAYPPYAYPLPAGSQYPYTPPSAQGTRGSETGAPSAPSYPYTSGRYNLSVPPTPRAPVPPVDRDRSPPLPPSYYPPRPDELVPAIQPENYPAVVNPAPVAPSTVPGPHPSEPPAVRAP